jgi:hypothetical protein
MQIVWLLAAVFLLEIARLFVTFFLPSDRN